MEIILLYMLALLYIFLTKSVRAKLTVIPALNLSKRRGLSSLI